MKKRISLYVRSVLTFLRIVITKIFNIKIKLLTNIIGYDIISLKKQYVVTNIVLMRAKK